MFDDNGVDVGEQVAGLLEVHHRLVVQHGVDLGGRLGANLAVGVGQQVD